MIKTEKIKQEEIETMKITGCNTQSSEVQEETDGNIQDVSLRLIVQNSETYKDLAR